MPEQKNGFNELNIIDPMRNLIQRVSMGKRDHSTQIIAFIAARFREGTSTVARDYAMMLASEAGHKVLLIDAGAPDAEWFRALRIDPSVGIVDAVFSNKLPSTAIHSTDHGIYVCRWIADDKNRTLVGKVIHDPTVWKVLSESFDAIVIDAPCLQSCFDGVIMASKADATVIVVEAERTPEPAVTNLRDTLAASGAKIAGVVLNKRRYYIPEKVYKRL